MTNNLIEIEKIKDGVDMLNCDEGEWNNTKEIIYIEDMEDGHLVYTFNLLIESYIGAKEYYISYNTVVIKELFKNKAREILNEILERKINLSNYNNIEQQNYNSEFLEAL